MTDYFQNWTNSLLTAPPVALTQPFEVGGEHNKHLGPRWEFAKVRFRVEPHDGLDLQIQPLLKLQSLEQRHFLTSAAYGLLDVLLTDLTGPVRNMRITVIDAEESTVDSNQHAFRMAGRDAGRKLLELLSHGA
ncbi:MAG TPA: hypothetical protein VF200_10210 [Woeseiaceae bacterium]